MLELIEFTGYTNKFKPFPHMFCTIAKKAFDMVFDIDDNFVLIFTLQFNLSLMLNIDKSNT